MYQQKLHSPEYLKQVGLELSTCPSLSKSPTMKCFHDMPFTDVKKLPSDLAYSIFTATLIRFIQNYIVGNDKHILGYGNHKAL